MPARNSTWGYHCAGPNFSVQIQYVLFCIFDGVLVVLTVLTVFLVYYFYMIMRFCLVSTHTFVPVATYTIIEFLFLLFRVSHTPSRMPILRSVAHLCTGYSVVRVRYFGRKLHCNLSAFCGYCSANRAATRSLICADYRKLDPHKLTEVFSLRSGAVRTGLLFAR
jgi:hypothetical protein